MVLQRVLAATSDGRMMNGLLYRAANSWMDTITVHIWLTTENGNITNENSKIK